MNRRLRLKQLLILIALTVGLLAAWWIRSSPVDSEQQNRQQELVQHAEESLRAGRTVAAETRLRQVLAENPENVRALLLLVLIAQDRGDLQQAQELAARLGVASGDELAEARFAQGMVALQSGDAVRAEQRFQEARDADPKYLPPLRELISLYALQQRRGDLLQATADASALRTLEPAELAMRLLAGRPVQENRQARMSLQKFVDTNPADRSSRIALLRTLLQSGAAGDAISPLRRESNGESDTDNGTSGLQLVLAVRSGRNPADIGVSMPYTLQAADPDEVWQLAAELATAEQDWTQLLQIAEYRRACDPWSPAASHQLALALEQTGQSVRSAQLRELTAELDQLEILAYRMLRPQAAIPEMGEPVMREIRTRLQRSGQAGEAQLWDALLGEQQVQAVGVDAEVERLVPVVLLEAEELLSVTVPARAAAAGGTFRDVAEQLQLQFSYHNGASAQKLITETVGGGAAVLDMDGDSWPDLYFPQGQVSEADTADAGSLLNDAFIRNVRGAAFVDCTSEAGVQELSHSMAAAVGDFDNDGFADVLIANVGHCRLLQNQGDGTFRDVTPDSLQHGIHCSSGACFSDLNADGFPELFVINYVEDWKRVCVNSAGQPATCDPRELSPAFNQLFLNQGNGEFTDVSQQSGLSEFPGRALGIVAADLNCDARTDLFIANDGMPNLLLTNLRSDQSGSVPSFTDAAAVSGVAVPESGRTHAGMGVALADFDWNGHADLFVTNFYREENTLYSGQSCGLFLDRTRLHGAGESGFNLLGFGVQAADFDADGWSDVLISNGDIDDYSASGRPWKMPLLLLLNDATGRLQPAAADTESALQTAQLGRGLSLLDADGDDRVDVVVVRHDGPVRLLRNEFRQQQQMVALRIVDSVGCRDGSGAALVGSAADGAVRIRQRSSGDGFAAANESVVRIPRAELRTCQWQVRWSGDDFSDMSLSEIPAEATRLILLRRSGRSALQILQMPR